MKKVKSSKRDLVRRKIAKRVKEMILDDSASSISSVNFKGFAELSPDYADKKKAQGKGDAPNLRLKGKLMKSLGTRIKGNEITWGHIGAEKTEKLKSYNHNVGDTVPRRHYLPNDSGAPVELESDGRKANQFRSGILREIEDIIKQYSEDE